MKPVYGFLDWTRSGVRSVVQVLAKGLNTLTGGRLSPNAVTWTSLIAHIPIAWLIATWHNKWAALLLVVFGLLDTLDGELARLQHSESKRGMLLDSITDRVKEVILYIGIVYAFAYANRPGFAVWSVAALGFALVVSYVNAWGEAVLVNARSTEHQENKSFRSGLMSFDLRITVLVIGLLFNRLSVAVIIIAILAALTVVQRVNNIFKELR
jgi:phosphatidylglycerophosphate synthase